MFTSCIWVSAENILKETSASSSCKRDCVCLRYRDRYKCRGTVYCVCVCVQPYMFLLPFATCRPEVIHRLNRYWQPVCSIVLLCPVGTSAAHADNLVLNWEEHGLRIWSNYLCIKRPWWNWRTSDAGSARTFKWETSRELARVGWVSGGRIKSRRGLYFPCVSLHLVSVN